LIPRYNQWLHQQSARSLPDALTYLDQQIKQQPTGELHHFRAIVLSELGRTDDAIQEFEAAIQMGVGSSNVFLNRGLAWSRAKQLQRAMVDFDAAIDLDNKNSHAYFNRGVLQSQSGRSSLAISDFDRAIALDPAFAEAFNNRGVVHEAAGNFPLALADYNRAIELRSRYPAALTNRAGLRQREGAYADAIADYAAALRMAPDAHPTLNDLAWLLATCPDDNVRNGAAALRYAERANDLTQQQDGDYLDTLAAAAAAVGDFDRAVAAMDAAIPLTPEAGRAELRERRDLFARQLPYVDRGKIAPSSADDVQAEPSASDATTAAP
jgi:tetratricopeptide (TPR) repeat protein